MVDRRGIRRGDISSSKTPFLDPYDALRVDLRSDNARKYRFRHFNDRVAHQRCLVKAVRALHVSRNVNVDVDNGIAEHIAVDELKHQ